MAFVLSSVSGNLISAASAGYAPTNSADVSAIASAYQVVSATATQLYAGTAYLTSVNEAPLSASRAGNAANAALATSAYYDGTGRLISALPDSAAVSSIASSYAESAASGKLDESAIGIDTDLVVVSSINDIYVSAWIAGSAEHWYGASGKQDTLTFDYDDDKISAINGSALAGQGGGMITSIQSSFDPWYATAISGLNGSALYPKWAESAKSAQNASYASQAASASYAESAPTAWASSFITGVASPSGTIRVLGGTAIETTNSAVIPSTVIEGFSTSYAGNTLGPYQKLHCVLPTANPYTEIIMPFDYNPGQVVWSSDNGIENTWEKGDSPETITAQVPDATAVDIWVSDAWIGVNTVTASAATQEIGGGVAELAWASAIPTYSYDAEDKISAINGSAIAGGGGATGDYVEKSATDVAIGSAVSASGSSMAQGSRNTAYSHSFAQGYLNGATSQSFAQGNYNNANIYSFAQGVENNADSDGFAQGYKNTGRNLSFAQGERNSADMYSFAQGNYSTAYGVSFAQGSGVSAKYTATVFGINNLSGNGSASSGAAFVIGDGTAYNARHDLMVVTKDGEITMYSGTTDTTGTGIMSSIRALSANAGGVDSATVSAIASSYAESAASGKLDASASSSFYTTANESGFVGSSYVDSAVSSKLDTTAFSTVSGNFLTGVDLSPYQTTADMSSYIPTSVSSDFQQVTGMSSYALSSDVSATVDLVGTQSANWGGSALQLSAGAGISLVKSGNILIISTASV